MITAATHCDLCKRTRERLAELGMSLRWSRVAKLTLCQRCLLEFSEAYRAKPRRSPHGQ